MAHYKGRVKCFNNANGYGFIGREDGQLQSIDDLSQLKWVLWSCKSNETMRKGSAQASPAECQIHIQNRKPI